MIGFCGLASANPTDSIGTKVKNGKIFILHKVEKAQGLFSISRRYGVALNDIILANPGSDKLLKVDQILLIPTGKDAKMEEKAVVDYFSEDKENTSEKAANKPKKTTFAKFHTVEAGETLYSISVKYNTKVDVIKDLNGLESDVLTLGQQLMVPSPKEEKPVETGSPNPEKSNPEEQAQPVAREKGKVSEIKGDKYQVSIEKMPKYNVEKVTEKGFVDSYVPLTTSSNTRVCSHHNASIGSTVMVTNPTNQKSVFVKVVANHTLNESRGDIILLSETAMTDIEIHANDAINVSFAR